MLANTTSNVTLPSKRPRYGVPVPLSSNHSVFAPERLLGRRVQLVEDLPYAPHMWWWPLRGRNGTALPWLNANSIAPPRIPVLFEVAASLAHGPSWTRLINKFCLAPNSAPMRRRHAGCQLRLDVQPRYLRPIAFSTSSMSARAARRRPLPSSNAGEGATEDASSTASAESSSSSSSSFASSSSRGPAIILTVATAGYMHWLCHLRLNLAQLGVDASELRVCVFDDDAEAQVRAEGMTPVRAARMSAPGALGNLSNYSSSGGGGGGGGGGSSSSSSSGSSSSSSSSNSNGAAGGSSAAARGASAATFASAEFNVVARDKQACIWRELRRLPVESGRLLFLDADVTLLTDPRMHMPLGSDLVVSDDSGEADWYGKYNIGLFMARSTRRVQRFAAAYEAELRLKPTRNDQELFNELLVRRAVDLRLRVHVLDQAAFMSGFNFYQRRQTHGTTQEPVNFSRLVTVHHNFMSGDDNKWARARAFHMLLRPGEPWTSFYRRAGLATRLIPADKPLRWRLGAAKGRTPPTVFSSAGEQVLRVHRVPPQPTINRTFNYCERLLQLNT